MISGKYFLFAYAAVCVSVGSITCSSLAAQAAIDSPKHLDYRVSGHVVRLDIKTDEVVLLNAKAGAINQTALAGWSRATATPNAGDQPTGGNQVDATRAVAQADFASPLLMNPRGDPMWITPYVLFGLDPSIKAADAKKLISAIDPRLQFDKEWSFVPGLFRFKVTTTTGWDVWSIANASWNVPGVQFAEPDFASTVRHSLIPNDPLFSSCWGIRNTGQSGGLSDFDMQVDPVWDQTIGSSSVITVVIDTGVQLNHPDLNAGPGADFTGEGTGGYPGNQCDNHGTAVAGCISGRMNNSLGAVGVAPGTRVASARVGVAFVPCNGFSSGQVSWTVDALNWAASIGASVTNNSNDYGAPSNSISAAYAATRNNNRIVHFAAAGNESTSSIGYPASDASVQGVAAANRFGSRASFSNWGTGLDFTAPGEAIQTTDRTGSAGYGSGDYLSINGTSFASPYAAGVAALMRSVSPSLTASEVESTMRATSRDMGTAGYDTNFGWGLPDARRAIDSLSGVWVDFGFSGTERGTFLNPYNTLAEGINASPSGGIVSIKPGSQAAGITITRNVTISAPQGGVTIGR